MPDLQPTTDMAARLRAIVQPKKGRPSPLAILTDAQLMQVTCWAQEEKPNDFIAQVLMDVWGVGIDLGWKRLVSAIEAFREGLPKQEQKSIDMVAALDPIAKNAALINELQEKVKIWDEKAMVEGAPKATLEHSARLNTLLVEAIQNHAAMQAKLNGGGTQKPPQKSGSNFAVAGNMHVLLQLGGSEDGQTEELITSFQSGLRELAIPATKITKVKANARTRSISPEEEGP